MHHNTLYYIDMKAYECHECGNIQEKRNAVKVKEDDALDVCESCLSLETLEEIEVSDEKWVKILKKE